LASRGADGAVSIIVHGGAGAYDPGKEHEKALVGATESALDTLKAGGSSADAIVAAVVFMEDAEVLNAGYGSSINLDGDVENDASIMLDDRSCGAIAAAKGIANPILAARLVMDKTDHVMLAGVGAEEFARRMGLDFRDQRSPARMEKHKLLKAKLGKGDDIRFLSRLGDLARELGHGTVGAVVRDASGQMAAGSSTGGMMLKVPGRVGDTGIIGAGTYCGPEGGASATGHGEPIIRYGMSREVVAAFAELGAVRGMERVMALARREGFEFGLVGIDRSGVVAHGFTAPAMSWASNVDGVVETFLGRTLGEA